MTVDPDLAITTAATADADAVAATLAAAFTDDPVFGWLMPRDATRPAALRRFFTIEAAAIVLPHGQSRVARTTAGIVGVALVLPAGAWRASLPVLARHSAGFLRAFGFRTPQAFAINNAMERHHPREPHYYLPYIGVQPDAHNRGIGTALLAPVLARADDEGLPTYLEASNPDCARLYRRLGFRSLRTLRPAGSPPIDLMRRAAPLTG